MWTKGMEWLTVIRYNAGHVSEQRNYFFTCWTWQFLRSFLLLTLYGARMTRRQFRLSLMWNLIEIAGSLRCSHWPTGRPMVLKKQATGLAVNFSNHWPVQYSRLYCCVCSAWGIKKRVQVKCKDCDVGLCIGVCFETYHTKSKALCSI
jgi:hypothetical protein